MKNNKSENMKEAMNFLAQLETKLTERIADLHQVKGGMPERHNFCYYRDILASAIKLIQENK